MTLRWYRSWPAAHEFAEHNLEARPHVVDDLPRIEISGHNYQNADWLDSPDDNPGFCMLEWDVALDPVARRAFAAEALVHPAEVLVASYRFHDTEVSWQGNDGGGPDFDSRPARGCDVCGESRTDSFGLGCIYLPRERLVEFCVQMDHLGFTDYTFGRWYRARFGPARITWRVHPQHLHDYEVNR